MKLTVYALTINGQRHVSAVPASDRDPMEITLRELKRYAALSAAALTNDFFTRRALARPTERKGADNG